MAVEMLRLCALLMMTMYGHGEMVIMVNWDVEALMVVRLIFILYSEKRSGGTMLKTRTVIFNWSFKSIDS